MEPELGSRLLNQVKADTTQIAKIAPGARLEGGQIVMIITPEQRLTGS